MVCQDNKKPPLTQGLADFFRSTQGKLPIIVNLIQSNETPLQSVGWENTIIKHIFGSSIIENQD